MALNQTVCHIIKNGQTAGSPRKLLLKMGRKGFGTGKWNASGGHVEEDEGPEVCAARETREETGLRVRDLFYHGMLDLYNNGGKELSVKLYVFSTVDFSGEIRASDEGEVRWFGVDRLPLRKMWANDRLWLPHMLRGEKFYGYFYMSKDNRRVVSHEIVLR